MKGLAVIAALAFGGAAWGQGFEPIHDVLSHPRCANCHVGIEGVPLWHQDGAFVPHGMNIRAGESRMGIETLPCGTCHGQSNSPVAHGAPGAPGWALPPPEMAWAMRSPAEICAQLKDPERNGGRTLTEVAEHVGHDPLVLWGWAPGPGRAPAPGTPEALMAAIEAWDAEGAPCP